jgi:hypothetical protein
VLLPAPDLGPAALRLCSPVWYPVRLPVWLALPVRVSSRPVAARCQAVASSSPSAEPALPSAGPSGGPSSSPALCPALDPALPPSAPPSSGQASPSSGQAALKRWTERLSSAGLVLAPRSSPSLSSQDECGPSAGPSSTSLPGPSAAQRQTQCCQTSSPSSGTECFPSAPSAGPECWYFRSSLPVLDPAHLQAAASGSQALDPVLDLARSRGYSQVSLPAPVPAVPPAALPAQPESRRPRR